MSNKRPFLIGIGGSDHDFSAAIAKGDNILGAIEQERVSRIKHSSVPWYADPIGHSLDYCLALADARLDQVEKLVAADTLPAKLRARADLPPIELYNQHLCHAASAYMMLPPGVRAGIFVYDGYGSIVAQPERNDELRHLRETCSFFEFNENGFERLGGVVGEAFSEQDDHPIAVTNSVGLFYELVTGALGYDTMDSGKTMGLSSHGAPRYVALLEEFVALGRQMSDCFQCNLSTQALLDTISGLLESNRNSFEVRADIAASAQAIVDRTLEHCATFFEGRDVDVLCVSGGCGLNTVANARLSENSPRGLPVAIPPHCGDAGLALGALWLERRQHHQRSPAMTFQGQPASPGMSRPGRRYTEAERHSAVQAFHPRIYQDCSVASVKDLARRMADGAVVGLFNGPSEIGPRALGGRSIVADPRSAATRERINRVIKLREPYRPLAPMVLADNYERYFEDARQRDPFMLKIARATSECRRRAPAVVHVDGTARVQTIAPDGDPFLIELLRAFEDETGVGLLINTSFNRRGEPIVETPLDAVDAFLGLGLDGLYIDGDYYLIADREA
jgi:carbamoyltransferase